ncbi:hypothetical protein CCMA1212_001229 [Trichoderma ghanense]|uniref:Uncharacterized protein n=1 Tax=Trichoderma ghanense TaxID=65468 RepID=A0ABY2HI20_9HYPO
MVNGKSILAATIVRSSSEEWRPTKDQNSRRRVNIEADRLAPAIGLPEWGRIGYYRFRELRIQPATGSGGLHGMGVR